MAGVVATYADTSGPNYEGVFKVERYTLTNGSPTVAVAAGAGTGGTATIKSGSTDASGQIIVTTGTAIPGGGGTIAVLTLANTLAGTPSPTIGAGDANSATLLQGTSNPYAVATLTTVSIIAGSATASTAYTFNYDLPDAKVNLAITARHVYGSDTFIRGNGINVLSSSFTSGTATIGVRPNFTSGNLALLCRL